MEPARISFEEYQKDPDIVWEIAESGRTVFVEFKDGKHMMLLAEPPKPESEPSELTLVGENAALRQALAWTEWLYLNEEDTDARRCLRCYRLEFEGHRTTCPLVPLLHK